ncbi:MAG TPA: hypothetical protein VH134_12700 [Candidatus Dormibacteraeota bacterium]|nr:hypothetical protein [Candidatus Dormibacteraeota bacterium]
MPALAALTAGPALLALIGLGSPLPAHAQTAAATTATPTAVASTSKDKDSDKDDRARDKDKDEHKDKDEDDRDEDDDDRPTAPAPSGVPAPPTIEHGLVAPVTATRTVEGVAVSTPQAGSPLPLFPAALLGAGGSVLLVAGRRIGRGRS